MVFRLDFIGNIFPFFIFIISVLSQISSWRYILIVEKSINYRFLFLLHFKNDCNDYFSNKTFVDDFMI